MDSNVLEYIIKRFSELSFMSIENRISYLHFGDIDAGGFFIHQNLCEITGVKFKLFGMSEKELSNPEYKSSLHPLSENDILRLNELRKNPEYQSVVDFMLCNNAKLEQEIVSLRLMGK